MNETVPVALPPDADLQPLWRAWRRDGDVQARQQLIEAHLRFARMMAAKLYGRRYYAALEFDDYMQYATVGLMESVDRFDPDHGAKFETFAASRISGAILDGVTASSDIHEQLAARKRVLRERASLLCEDAAAPASQSPDALFGKLADLAIGLAVGFALEGSGMYRAEEGEYLDPGYQGVALRQLRQRVASLVDALPPKQKAVISGHYQQQLAFEEIATRLQLSRGRVAQLHKEAVAKLRLALQMKGTILLSC